jgi:hypothetical protein
MGRREEGLDGGRWLVESDRIAVEIFYLIVGLAGR